jgi:hypothetical protein
VDRVEVCCNAGFGEEAAGGEEGGWVLEIVSGVDE